MLHRVDAETIAIALTAQRELATLHVDRHYETLARVLAFAPARLTT
jgi:hypothetical protein